MPNGIDELLLCFCRDALTVNMMPAECALTEIRTRTVGLST